MEESHLLPLSSLTQEIDLQSDSSISSDDDVVENVIQMLDDLINLSDVTNELQDSEEDGDQQQTDLDSPISSMDYSTTTNPIQSTTYNDSNDKSIEGVSSKRRSWTVQEKINVINAFKKCGNVSQVSRQYHCDRKQIREWLKKEQQLLLIKSQKNRKKLKRLKGASAKICHKELDQNLIQWFKSKRTDPNDEKSKPPSEIKKERITFKTLVHQGEKICVSLKIQPSPSKMWFRRFLKRHNLSLQKPKRQQKLTLPEAHGKVNEFLTFVRKSASRVLNLGVSGSFPDRDICNMDESPLALFGDQSKVSINYVNTPNEVEGRLNNKRFCTLMLTVFGDDNSRVGPALIFKGKGHVSEKEKKEYDKTVKVYFSPSAFVNSSIMKNYTEHWLSKTRDGRPKMFITDSCSSHFGQDVKTLFKKDGVVLGIIPGGITQYVQVLDVFVFNVFKAHYYDAAEEWIEVNGPRSSIKLTSSQQRILCTRLTSTAWKRTLKSVNFSQSFRNLGYTWSDNSVVKIKSLPGYSFNPESLSFGNDIDEEISSAKEMEEVSVKESVPVLKQSKLFSFWKK